MTGLIKCLVNRRSSMLHSENNHLLSFHHFLIHMLSCCEMCRNNNKCVDAVFPSLKSWESIGSRRKRLGNIDSVLRWTATWEQTWDTDTEEISSLITQSRMKKKATVFRSSSSFSCFSSTKHQMCHLSFLRLRIYCRSFFLNRLWASHRHFVFREIN